MTTNNELTPEALAEICRQIETGEIVAVINSDPPRYVLEAIFAETIKHSLAIGLTVGADGYLSQRERTPSTGLPALTRERTLELVLGKSATQEGSHEP